MAYRANDRLTLSAGLTQLSEGAGVFGGQGTGAFSLDGGSSTAAVTFDAGAKLPAGLRAIASVTAARTDGNRASGSALGFGEGAIMSSAWQFALERDSVIRRGDSLRVSVAQPLHVESGDLTLSATSVVDRETGALGTTTQTLGLDGRDRRYVTELLYGVPLQDGRARLSAFGQYQTETVDVGHDGAALAGGVRLSVDF